MLYKAGFRSGVHARVKMWGNNFAGLSYLILSAERTCNYSFIQSDFSGGNSTAEARHLINNTGWIYYYSKDTQINAGKELTLSNSVKSVTQTTKEDFESGSFKDTTIIGTGDDASISLEYKSSWQLATNEADWSPRRYHTSVVFDDKMWVIGGDYDNDVWYLLEGYPSSGEFNSRSIDFGIHKAIFDKISWNSKVPGNTSLKFQIATNNDNSTWNFLGPDGTNLTYYEAPESMINSIHNNSQYLKIKAFFATGSYNVTPRLDDVAILYRSAQGELISSPFNSTNKCNKIDAINWDSITPSNTEVKFQIRTAPQYDPLEGTFQEGSQDSFGGKRIYASAASYENKIYIFGGAFNPTYFIPPSDHLLNDLRKYYLSLWSSWCGFSLVCDGSNYLTSIHNGLLLPPDHPLRKDCNDKFFQFKAILSASDLVSTPKINSVEINYSFDSFLFSP